MHTYQIANQVLENYVSDKLTQERIDFLKAQAKEQLEEMSTKEELYSGYLAKVSAPQKIDPIILWMLLMSNETICDDYIYRFKKDYREIIPVSDLADLLIYAVHLKKLKDVTLDGFEYLLEYVHEGKDEVDQYAFTNALLYIQKSKEVEMEF